MKKLCVLCLFGLSFIASTAAADRLLVCSRGTSSATFSLCGVAGCSASVVNNGATASVYSLKRKKETTGALTYTPARNATRRCSFSISPLKNGVRKISNTPSCARGLKNASCNFIDQAS
jgi:hypothetical protein